MEDIFEATSCVQSLSAYLNSLEAEQNMLGLQIQALKDSELDAGLRALQQASRSEAETTFLVREARTRFNKALSLETGLRLAHAHVALAICHSNLGDGENAGRALQETLDVSIPPLAEGEQYLKGIGIGAGLGVLLSGPLGWLGSGVAILGTAAYRAHQSNVREALHAQQCLELEDLKETVRSYLHLPSDKSAEKRIQESVAETAANRLERKLLRSKQKRTETPATVEPMKVRVTCPACSNVSRVPAKPGRLRVVCPGCNSYFGVDV